ncbi:endo-1,4-beta-xylanase [Flavitalea antarctica]
MKIRVKKNILTKCCYLLLLFSVAFSDAPGQTLPALPDNLKALQPVNIFPADAVTTYNFSNRTTAGKTPEFTAGKTDATDVYTAEIFLAGKAHGDVQVSWKNTKPIKKGDVILARFALRAEYAKQESGEAVVYFIMNAPERLVLVDLTAGPEWRYMDIPFVSLYNAAAGDVTINFTFGALSQKVNVAGMEVLNFEKKIAVADLPLTKLTYIGREEGAAWRKDALKRIDEIRTAPISIIVVNKKGKPVEGATVRAKMLQSEFVWGTAVSEKWLNDDSADGKKYAAYLKKFFNTTTIGNGLKGGSWHTSEARRKEAMRGFNWLESNGFRQRGHNLVWPGWKFNGKQLRQLAEKDTVAFKAFINKSIEERMAFTKGRVIAWDVINELMHERDFFKFISEDEAVRWFQLAKKLDPKAQLFINEYSMLNSIASPQNIRRYLAMIADLRKAGAPIEAIGVQGHVGRQPRNPADVIRDLDLFKETGLPVQITEFDVNTVDTSLQADYTRDFVIACYSHPQVSGFTMWGFWESDHWKPDAAMVRKNWTEKPNAAVWREWVAGKWKTSFTKSTDAKGKADYRGHLGTYEITVTKGKSSVTKKYVLTKESGELKVVL